MNCISCNSRNIIKAFHFEYYDTTEIAPYDMATCDNPDHQDYFWNRHEFYDNIGDFKISEIKIHRRLSTNYDYIYTLYNNIKDYIYNDEFIVSSGDVVDWYIDGRAFILNKNNSILVGNIISDIIDNNILSIGGPSTAAIPIITTVINQNKNDMVGFYTRQENKKHGLQNKIEGTLLDNVVVVDDTCNTGESLLECINTVEDADSTVKQVIALFDRGDGGKKIKALGYNYIYVFRLENGEPIQEVMDLE